MHLGDLIHATSIIPLLKELYPNAQVSFLVNAGLESLFSNIGGVKEVIPYHYKSGGSYLGVYRMAQIIKKYNFDLSISLDPRTRLSIMMWLAGIPNRVGSPSVFGWKPGVERFFFNEYVELTGYDVSKQPMAYNFQKLIKRFANIKSDILYIPYFKEPSIEAIEYIETYTKSISLQSLRIALCVNTVDEARNWHPNNYNQLVKRLLEKYDAVIIGVGIKADEDVFLKSTYGIEKDRVLNLVGKTNFDQLNALFRKCDLLINPDNGMGHFAAAAGCPTVTLFSNASPEKFKPLHPLTEVVASNCECVGQCNNSRRRICQYRCLDMLTVEDVFKATEKFINEKRERNLCL